MNYTWTDKAFNELTVTELYAILRLRSEIFVVEQNCVFLDMDGKDVSCRHLMCWNEDRLMAYARILPPGISYEESSIGRIVSSREARGTGIGKQLLQRAIASCYALNGNGIIRIGAQLYLKGFYESFGFREASPVYLEDGIEHIEMLLVTN